MAAGSGRCVSSQGSTTQREDLERLVQEDVREQCSGDGLPRLVRVDNGAVDEAIGEGHQVVRHR